MQASPDSLNVFHGFFPVNEAWQALVTKSRSAGNHEDLSVSYLQRSDLLTDLSHQGLLRISGKDAAGFLQGQTTSDIAALSEGQSQLSALCSIAGKTLAILRILRWHERFYLCCFPEELTAAIEHRLRPYMLRADVCIEDCSNEYVQLGISGPRIERILGLTLPGPLPKVAGKFVSRDTSLVIRLPGSVPRYALWGESATLIPLWKMLAEHLEITSGSRWRLLDILAGLPSVDLQTTDSFVPQMLNLGTLEAISFSKGCYMGQEIVARTQHLGTVKRRTYLAEVGGARLPASGESLYSDNGRNVGHILNAEKVSDELNLMLAVIQTGAVQQDVHLQGADGASVEFEPLPYALPE